MFVQLVKNADVAKLFLAVILSAVFATYAEAQTVTVDINKAQLAIKYVAGVTPADGLNVKCGPTTGGPYSRITQTAIGTTLIPILKIVGGNGNWFCVVTDFVQTASGPLEGRGSNEINFFAATAPSGIITISIIP